MFMAFVRFLYYYLIAHGSACRPEASLVSSRHPYGNAPQVSSRHAKLRGKQSSDLFEGMTLWHACSLHVVRWQLGRFLQNQSEIAQIVDRQDVCTRRAERSDPQKDQNLISSDKPECLLPFPVKQRTLVGERGWAINPKIIRKSRKLHSLKIFSGS